MMQLKQSQRKEEEGVEMVVVRPWNADEVHGKKKTNEKDKV